MVVHGCTWLYMVIHCYLWLSIVIDGYTQFFGAVMNGYI